MDLSSNEKDLSLYGRPPMQSPHSCPQCAPWASEKFGLESRSLSSRQPWLLIAILWKLRSISRSNLQIHFYQQLYNQSICLIMKIHSVLCLSKWGIKWTLVILFLLCCSLSLLIFLRDFIRLYFYFCIFKWCYQKNIYEESEKIHLGSSGKKYSS